MNVFTDLWAVLTNRLSMARLTEVRQYADRTYLDFINARNERDQLKRDMTFMQAAIRELKSQLPADYEARRKAASDKLGEEAIERIKREQSGLS